MTPEGRFAIRRVATVWSVVALVELALWWLLYRNNYYRPLFSAPALLAPVGGVIATLHAIRVRGRDRRASERRVDERRDTPDVTPALTPVAAPAAKPVDTTTQSPG